MLTWQHLLVLLVPKVQTLSKSLGPLRMEIQTLIERPNIFSIKYSKFDKRIEIIYFNELLPPPLKRSLEFDLTT